MNIQSSVHRFLALLDRHQVELGDFSQAELEAALVQKITRLVIRRHPILHFINGLSSHWKTQIEGDRDLALVAGRLIDQMAVLMKYYGGTSSQYSAYDQMSLATRRLWLLATRDSRWLNSEWRESELRREGQLPAPSLAGGSRMMPAEEGVVSSFLSWAAKLQFGSAPENLLSVRDESDLDPDEGFPIGMRFVNDEITDVGPATDYLEESVKYTGSAARRLRENSAFTRINACSTPLEPFAFAWFAEVCQITDFRNCDDSDELLSTLLSLLELDHGIPASHAADLCLGEGTSGLGNLMESELRLRINSGYYYWSRCWVSDVLPMPLDAVTLAVLRELRSRFPGARTVREFCSNRARFSEVHRNIMMKRIRHYIPNWEGRFIRLDRVWQRLALSLDIPSSIVGLFRGRPLAGAWGQSAYISISLERLVKLSHQIHGELYLQAGARYTQPPYTILDPERLFGKRAISLGQYMAKTVELTKRATTRNELIAACVRILRALGYRRLNLLYNPVRFMRTEPLELLEIRDKLAGEWIPSRYVPLSPALLGLIEEIQRAFGDSEYLLYEHGGKLVHIDDLPKHEMRAVKQAMLDDRQWNAGRTGLYMALIDRKAGDIVRQVIMAHGPLATHMGGNLLPIPPVDVLDAARDFMLAISAEEGLDECARLLAQRISEFDFSLWRANARTKIEIPARRAELMEHTPFGIAKPMTYSEKLTRDAVYRRVQLRNFPDNARLSSQRPVNGWPTHGEGILGIISFYLHVPMKLLLTYQRFYSFRSFVWHHGSKSIYFLVNLGHHDAGERTLCAIKVCSIEDEKTNPIMIVVNYAFERDNQRRAYKRAHRAAKSGGEAGVKPDLELVESRIFSGADRPLFGSKWIRSRDVGAKLRFLLGEQGLPLSQINAFRKLERVVNISCAIYHSPLLAGAMSGRSEVGLNNFTVADLLGCKGGGTELIDITGAPWFENNVFDPTFEIAEPVPENWVVIDPALVRRWICPAGRCAPSRKRIVKLLMDHGFAQANARSLAAGMMRTFRKEGQLGLSKPLPYLTKARLEVVLSEARFHMQQEYKPRFSREKAALPQPSNSSLLEESLIYLRMMQELRVRPEEPWNSGPSDFICGGAAHYLLIREGKSENSERNIKVPVALGEELIQSMQRPDKINRGFPRLFPNLAWHYAAHGSITKSLAKRMSKAAGFELTPYDLRHLGIIYDVDTAIRMKLVNGNLTFALANVAAESGHGSLKVTVSTYVGSAESVFRR